MRGLFTSDKNLMGIGTKLFRKQLLRFGRWIHPANANKFFEVTPEFVDRLVANFKNKITGENAPIGLADKADSPHSFRPDETVGYIIDLAKEQDGLYAILEFGDPNIEDKAARKLLPGISAHIDTEYIDKQTGHNVGPVLKDAVLCNHPYIKNLRQFETIPLAENLIGQVLEFAEIEIMDKKKLLEMLKTEHGIDVEVIQTENTTLKTEKQNLTVKLSEVEKTRTEVESQLKTQLKTKDDEITTLKQAAQGETVKLAERATTLETELKKSQESVKSLSDEMRVLKLAEVTKNVEQMIKDGKILPKDKEHYIKLADEHPDIWKGLAERMSPVVNLSEKGVIRSSTQVTGKSFEFGAKETDEAVADICKNFSVGKRPAA